MYVNRLLNAVREDNYDAAFEEAAAIDDHLATADAATLSEVGGLNNNSLNPFIHSLKPQSRCLECRL